jgi:hypothetical protein
MNTFNAALAELTAVDNKRYEAMVARDVTALEGLLADEDNDRWDRPSAREPFLRLLGQGRWTMEASRMGVDSVTQVGADSQLRVGVPA